MGSVKRKAVSEHSGIEATSLHGVGRNADRADRTERINQLLIVEIEEQLVLEDRPTDRTAKVVETLPRLGAGPVEVVSRVQRIILEIIIGSTVKLIGSALADEIEYIATAAILCGGGRGNHVHFGHGFALALVNVGAVRQPNRATVNQIAGEVWHGSGDGLIDSRILITIAATIGATRGAGSAGKQLQETGPAVRRINAREVGQLLR